MKSGSRRFGHNGNFRLGVYLLANLFDFFRDCSNSVCSRTPDYLHIIALLPNVLGKVNNNYIRFNSEVWKRTAAQYIVGHWYLRSTKIPALCVASILEPISKFHHNECHSYEADIKWINRTSNTLELDSRTLK